MHYLKALPRQTTPIEIHQYVSQRLHVVPSTLFDPKMRVDASVPRSSRQILVFSIGYVLTRSVVSVFLG